jgi:heme exporter protein D
MAASALISSTEMLGSLKYLLGDVRWTEAIAAIALVVQAFILWQHRRILTGFGETLERQAETAKMIGHSLEQHGRILADHTRIMDEQFKLQKKLEAKIEYSTTPAASLIR